jgi:hypothetical protein
MPFDTVMKESQMKAAPYIWLICILLVVFLSYNVSLGQLNDDFGSDNQPASVRFINFTSINGAIGSNTGTYGVKFINGALVKNVASLGFGIGYDRYSNNSMVPVFMDLRFFPDFRGDQGAFFFADIGYSLASNDLLKDTNTIGFYFNGGVGLIFLLRGTTGMTFDAGYKIQHHKVYWNRFINYGNWGYSESGANASNYTFFTFSMGVTF